MIKVPLDIIWLILFHILDMVFTMLLIKKASKKYKNAEDVELNYHRFFFKKVGIVKGGLISMLISLPVVILLGIWAYNINPTALYIIIGIQFGIAYINYMSWTHNIDLKPRET